MALVPVEDSLRQVGRDLYIKGGAMRDLATVMEHPEMQHFYRKYMCDPDLALVMIRMMQLYEHVGQTVQDPYAKLGLVHCAITNPELRKSLFSHTPLLSDKPS